ncbi:unnamed protein product [Prunus armeniaca]|uniref:Uncharacterized protein n=1 Tax=Prunus armeniaca TaxID=36596 RepID=A0A6J5TZH4_PRUAR|nr:unnamed protein product [Prunus armeniaca]CAB4315206.1 unnamed protein product [Prunus armeniaca]
MFSSHKTHRFIKRISFPKFKTASFHFGIIRKKTRAQWSSSSQELRLRQPQLQLQEIFRRGEQWEPRAACVLQTAWRRCKREKLQKSPRLAKEGSLSATDHHAVSETQHK